MNKVLSVCGCECSMCLEYRKRKCAGCNQIQGKVWWVGYIKVNTCPIYDCVIKTKKILNCGVCAEIPCTLWYELKDPNLTEEQHQQSILERAEKLKNSP